MIPLVEGRSTTLPFRPPSFQLFFMLSQPVDERSLTYAPLLARKCVVGAKRMCYVCVFFGLISS